MHLKELWIPQTSTQPPEPQSIYIVYYNQNIICLMANVIKCVLVLPELSLAGSHSALPKAGVWELGAELSC